MQKRLQDYQRVVMAESGDKQVRCVHCHKLFANLKTLRVHHLDCEIASTLSCAASSGKQCDKCSYPAQGPAPAVPKKLSRIGAAISAAAAFDVILPSLMERLYSLSADGREMFAQPLFSEDDVAKCMAEATKALERCNELARLCPMHTCQAIMINSIGLKKSRIYLEHQAATVVVYAQTLARLLAFLMASDAKLEDAIAEEIDGSKECTVTRFLMHEAAHNIKYQDPDKFQHGAMHLQRVWRGFVLEGVYLKKIPMSVATKMVDPSVPAYSFYALSTMYTSIKELVPPDGNVQVVVNEPAKDSSGCALPVSVDIITRKKTITVQVRDIERFVRDNLKNIREKLDSLDIPKFSLDDITDDMHGPGAGIMQSNEHLFPFSAQETWIEVRV